MGEHRPRVSVVTTVYNGEAYAERATRYSGADLRGLRVHPGRRRFAGSHTRDPARFRPKRCSCAGLLAGWAPGGCGRFQLWHCARQRKYIARQDIDDGSYPDRLKASSRPARSGRQIGAVGGYYVLVDENRGKRPYGCRQPPPEILRAMARYIPLAHTISTFRRTAWVEAGGYPEVRDLVDMHFWLRLAKQGWEFANIPEIIGEHIVYGESFSHIRYGPRQRKLANCRSRWSGSSSCPDGCTPTRWDVSPTPTFPRR